MILDDYLTENSNEEENIEVAAATENNTEVEELTAEEEAVLAEDLNDPNAFFEAFLLEDISRMSDAEKEAFVNSEACEMLIKEGMIAKRNIVKLTKSSDMERRTIVAALAIAKSKGDTLYAKALKYRALSKQCIAKIAKKYGSKAERSAKIAQKAYIRKNPITQRIVATPEKIDKKELFAKDTATQAGK